MSVETRRLLRRARNCYQELARRRTAREFSAEPVPRELIELAILTAGTAPSGAQRQPWRFVAVSDPLLKAQIHEEAAIHHMGLATFTHTPSPMGFLSDFLKRPKNETPVLLMPVGYPASDAEVPVLGRKSLGEILQWNAGTAHARQSAP